jgi:Ca2+-binding RTX toxin-like protein
MAYTRIVENLVLTSTLRLDSSEWDNTLVRNVTIKNASGDGIFIKGVKNVKIENVTIDKVSGSGIRLSSTDSTKDVVLENNKITNIGVNGIGAAQRIADGVDHPGLVIRGNHIQNTGQKSPGNGLDHGIYVQTSDVLVEYNTVLNSAAGNGISIRSSGVVQYNTIDGAYEAGVGYFPDHMAGPSDKLVVHGNVIKNWGKASANYGGVMIKTGSDHSLAVDDFVTTNNQFGSGASSGDAWYIQSNWYNGHANFQHSGDAAWTPGKASPASAAAPASATSATPTSPNGGSGNDWLVGGSGKDTLVGDAGNDHLAAKLGNDVLTGGAGKDTFVFDTKLSKTANRDKITDFNVKSDTIWLDNKYMSKLGKGSSDKALKIKKDFFSVDYAKDGNDHVIYNKTTGVLSYDADGTGAKAAVDIAVLKKGLNVNYHDIFVI